MAQKLADELIHPKPPGHVHVVLETAAALGIGEGNFNNRILIDACIPYNQKLRCEFAKVVEVPEGVRAKLKTKFPQVFKAKT